jgi:two-component system chemotaxis response regulator CheY
MLPLDYRFQHRVPSALFERLNILIVDGNRHMRTVVKGVLRAFGVHSIHEASDGPEALKELLTVPINLIITEYALQTLDGLELVRMIRTAKDSVNPSVPIIMLTGHTEKHVVADARDKGINEFLAKPISAEALYARLVNLVFHPRPFVTCKVYTGPDRRRHLSSRYKGDERRVEPPPSVKDIPLFTPEEIAAYLENIP